MGDRNPAPPWWQYLSCRLDSAAAAGLKDRWKGRRFAFGRTVLLVGLFPFLALAAPVGGAAKSQPLFESDEALSLRLEIPTGALLRQENEGEEWLPGSLSLVSEGEAAQAFDVGVRVRGNFRRTSGSCNFPPFWINLKKSQVKGTVFEHQDRLKVVGHCQERKSSYHTYVFREYLAYKTLNLLTDASFRVRLIEIDYIDTEGKRKTGKHPGFLIEHHDNVADRLGGKVFEGKVVLPEFFDLAALARAELFQFLIGNTDFSFVVGAEDCCHNAKAVVVEHRAGGYIPVPYDFDLSGLVDAPYAEPHPSLPIQYVTDRLYRGVQIPPEIFDETIRLFQDRREAILDLWRTTDLLDEREKRRLVSFLEGFYRILDDEKAVEKSIRKRMRGIDSLTQSLKKRYPDSVPAAP